MKVIEVLGEQVGILSMEEFQERSMKKIRGEAVDHPEVKVFCHSEEKAEEAVRRSRIQAILVLTTLGFKKDSDRDSPDNRRTVAWYPKDEMETVVEGLSENMGDLEEAGYYQWAVIEETHWGLYPHIEACHWFRFDQEKGGFFPCDPPEWAANTCNFGIG